MHVVPSMRITESPRSRGAIFLRQSLCTSSSPLWGTSSASVATAAARTLDTPSSKQTLACNGWYVDYELAGWVDMLILMFDWCWKNKDQMRLFTFDSFEFDVVLPISIFSAKFRPFFPSQKPSPCDPMGMIHGHHQFSWPAAPPWPWLPHHLHAPPTTTSVRPQRAHARRGAPNVEGLLSRWQGHRGGPPREIKGSVLRCLEILRCFHFDHGKRNTSLSVSESMKSH